MFVALKVSLFTLLQYKDNVSPSLHLSYSFTND